MIPKIKNNAEKISKAEVNKRVSFFFSASVLKMFSYNISFFAYILFIYMFVFSFTSVYRSSTVERSFMNMSNNFSAWV